MSLEVETRALHPAHPAETLGHKTSIGLQAPPGLLRCLIASWDPQRADQLRLAASEENWDAVVCKGTTEVLQNLFRVEAPLAVFDVSLEEHQQHQWLLDATGRTVGFGRPLVAVCTDGTDEHRERWARETGVWAFLPDAKLDGGVRVLFQQARQAVARTAVTSWAPLASW